MSALAMEQDGGAAAPAGRAGGAPSLEAAVGGAGAVSGVAVVWVVRVVASSCRRVVVPRVPCSISNGFRNLFYFVLSCFYLFICSFRPRLTCVFYTGCAVARCPTRARPVSAPYARAYVYVYAYVRAYVPPVVKCTPACRFGRA